MLFCTCSKGVKPCVVDFKIDMIRNAPRPDYLYFNIQNLSIFQEDIENVQLLKNNIIINNRLHFKIRNSNENSIKLSFPITRFMNFNDTDSLEVKKIIRDENIRIITKNNDSILIKFCF